MRIYRASLAYAIPMFISVAIGVMLVKQVRLVSLSNTDNVISFFSFSEDLEKYKELRQEWRPRIAANYLAGRLANFIQEFTNIEEPREAMKYIPGVWTAGWFLLISALLIGLFRTKALFYIFGLFAGVSFGYLPDLGNSYVYPWDLPALFIFVCFIVILEKDRRELLVPFIPLAILFKETALLMVIAFLFWEDVPLCKRIGYLAATVVLSLVAKGAVDIITDNPSLFFTMTSNGVPEKWRYIGNWQSLFPLRTSHPVFINAGLLMTLLLLPLANNHIKMMKAMAVPFIVAQFFFGVMLEFRIWFELIPLALYGIDLLYLRQESPLASPG